MTDHPVDSLSAFLDDELDVTARAAVAAHLADCAACRAVLDDVTRVRDEARAWRDQLATPSAAMWATIATRLETPAPRGATVLPWYRRRFTVGIVELAAAASVVVALGGALLVTTVRRAPVAEGPAPIVAQMEPTDAPDTEVAAVSFADAQFDAAVTDLERVLREQRDRLNPRTVLVLERNLATIDDAIREARQALASDPANALLNAHLAEARRRKLTLLRRAAQITEGD